MPLEGIKVIDFTGCPMKFSDFTPNITGAPLLGEHTDQVLTELGYSKEQIAKLRDEKVVGSTGLSPAHRDDSHSSAKGTSHGK